MLGSTRLSGLPAGLYTLGSAGAALLPVAARAGGPLAAGLLLVPTEPLLLPAP
jgi:hypothetical protein